MRKILLGVLVAVPVIAAGAARLWVPSHGAPFVGPGDGHLLGTDHLGRDVWHQLLQAGIFSVWVPAGSAGVLTVLGVASGIGIGLCPTRLREVLVRIVDLVLVLPGMVLLLVVIAGLGGSAAGLVSAVVGLGWASVARLFAQATAQIAGSGHVELAQTAGRGGWQVIVGEIWPRLRHLVAADAGLRLIAATQMIAAAAFLGFGSANSWGAMARDGMRGMSLNPWATLAPSLAVVGVLLGIVAVLDSSSAGRPR